MDLARPHLSVVERNQGHLKRGRGQPSPQYPSLAGIQMLGRPLLLYTDVTFSMWLS
jgi:hypothetical protein